ncbi:hypothetical protein [Paraburkholderia ferrariae]|uniref:hypothetical protein n=1 Tax=Paraburkholderia ferrariae TaxID=386056 RepID=UPI0005A880BF|nr:hypothetical protein [Paraburkholderia ferrariae]
MNAVSNVSRTRLGWTSAERLERVLLTCTVAIAGILFWIAPRPGMGDLPQHAAQIAMLHDLVTGTSSWSDLVRVNYFTPYLLAYGLALALSFVMPVVASLKLVMMLAFYAYVGAGIKLRQAFNADSRLDWLYVPGFFGFAYQFGFYSFIVAVPVALLFLILARRFAQAGGFSTGVSLLLAGVGLFFSHGLVFLLACATGAAFIPFFRRTPARFAAALAPYALLGVLALAWYVHLHHSALLVPGGVAPYSGTEWGWSLYRCGAFLLYTVATQSKDWYLLPGVLVLLAAPWLMGAKLNRRDPTAFLPFAALLLIWFVVPSDALGTSFLYQRFAIFLLPAYALMFRAPTATEQRATARRLSWFDRPMLARAAVMLFCWCYLTTLGVRAHRFAQDSASFETVLAAAEPGQRALSLVYAPDSAIIHNPFTYHSYPVWYQVDKNGFVDFNFAAFLPQIVRFKPDRIPAMRPSMGDTPEAFDWHAVHGRLYRYFFVRHTQPLPANLFKNDECEVALVKEAGEWSLFERRTCR